MRKHQEKAQVLENKQLTENIYNLSLRAPSIAKEARAGQFVMVRINDGFDPFLRRPFSIFDMAKEEGIIKILYRIVGKGTSILATKRAGTFLDVIGPLGNGFWFPSKDLKVAWFIAGGIGIATLIPCIKALRERSHHTKVVLFYGAKSASDFINIEEFKEICHEIKYSTDDGSYGFCGSALGCAIDNFGKCEEKPSYVYACGPPIMLKHLARWVMDQGIPSQFSLESLMGCGVGACLGCAIPKKTSSLEPSYVHVCFEGPVFSPEVIEWSKM